MASWGYDYGGGSITGGKIRRRPPSHSAVASPYARRPAPAPVPAHTAAAASQGGGWLSRIIVAGATRLVPFLFGNPPPQLTAPALPPEPLEEPPSRDLLPEPQPKPLDAPFSPLPPPLEDDLPEAEENGGEIANNLCTEKPESSAKEEDGMLRTSYDHGGMYLEELLKQKTFTRNEFEYLAGLLWSRTIRSGSLKPEDDSIRKMNVSEKENESRHSNLPVDFSTRAYSVADQVASPAEIAKAYMGSKSSKGSPLRLRLHDPYSMPIKSMEANMTQKAKPPTIPLLQGSRMHTSKTSDRHESNCATPNRSAIYKMSSSPYFKVLKRKSTAVNNETVSVGPIRKMRQRYNRTSPLLETRPGYRRYVGGHVSKLDEDFEQSAQNQKRHCLDKVGDATLGCLDDNTRANSFGQAPVQSAEMAAKILKQLDTLVPSQKEDKSEIKHKHWNAMDAEDIVSRKKKISAQSNLLEPSPSEVKENSLLNGVDGSAKFVPAAVTENSVDGTLNRSDALMNDSFSQITSNKGKPPTFSLRNHAPNLVLSSEIDRNKMQIPPNGFTFPVPAVLGTHSQAPPTPTMASPPMLPVEKQQPSAAFTASITSADNGPRISKSVLEEGSIAQKCDNKFNADDKPRPSKNSRQGASFTSNPVFKVTNSKPTILSNGPGHMLNSTVSAVLPSNGSSNSASSPSFGFSYISTNSASRSTQSSSTGGSFTFSNTGMGRLSAASSIFAGTSSQSAAVPSLASSGTGSGSAPSNFSPLFGTTSSSAAQDKSKEVIGSTPFSGSRKFGTASTSAAQDESKAISSTPFSFSQQFRTTSSYAAQDISKPASPEPTIFPGNCHAQLGNINSLFTQGSLDNVSFKSSGKSNCGSLQSSADSPVGSSPLGSSPFNSSSAFSLAACSGSGSVTITAPSSFGLPNTGSATSPFSSTSSAVFSFTSATPIPNLSLTTPIFGGMSPSAGTNQMNGGNMIGDKNMSPSSTVTLFGIPSNSPSTPSTPVFSTPSTQFASTPSALPGMFHFAQQGQASSGGFSMGSGGVKDKSGRKFIKVKRKK